jgi:protein-disulfide isomerase
MAKNKENKQMEDKKWCGCPLKKMSKTEILISILLVFSILNLSLMTYALTTRTAPTSWGVSWNVDYTEIENIIAKSLDNREVSVIKTDSWDTQIAMDYNKIRQIIRDEILSNEYEKMWGKENFELINQLQLPQIQQAVAQYKAKLDEGKPKVMELSQVKEILADGYNKWDKNADILWLEFSELECPYCSRFYNSNAADKLNEKYWDSLNHSFRHYPLDMHKNAMPAALALECVWEQKWSEAFYSVIDKSFTSGKSDIESIYGFAKEAGADVSKVKSCVESQKYKNKIDAQQSLWLGKFNITWTPGNVFINTKTGKYIKVSGAAGATSLIEAIEKIK